jgi:hypothetical protein
MPRATSKTKQAALEELVLAAMALATRYRTDCAQRGEAPVERFISPFTGKELDNEYSVPVPLLNRLQKASSSFAQQMVPLSNLRPDGQDC